MFNEVCPGVSVAAIGKERVPSVSGGYGRFRTIGLMLFDRGHAKDVPLLSWWTVFRCHTFLSYWPPNFTEDTEKSAFFWKKRPFNGKISKFRYERIHADTDSRIRFAEIGEAECDQTGAWYSSQKSWYFCTYLCASGAISPNFFTITPNSPSPAKFCPNPSSFRGDIISKINIIQTHYNIGVKHSRRQ